LPSFHKPAGVVTSRETETLTASPGLYFKKVKKV
jgi:hypothetical protein